MFKQLLVALDGSALAECALPHAVAFVRAFGAPAVLVRVVAREPSEEHAEPIDPVSWQWRRAEAEAYLQRVSERLGDAGVLMEPVLLEGTPSTAIIDYAHARGVDLLVLSSHGLSGLSQWNISSVARKLVTQADLSSLVVRAYRNAGVDLEGARYEKILLPLDGSMRAECATQPAITLARHFDATVVLAHVVREPDIPRRMPPSEDDLALADQLTQRNLAFGHEYLAGMASRLGVRAETRVQVSARVGETLHTIGESEGADLIAMCAHGYSGKSRWPYGSIAVSFIEYASRPVLIVQDLSPGEMEAGPAERAARERKGH